MQAESKSTEEQGLIVFGPYLLDASQRTLHRDGQVVPIQPKPLDLIIALARRPGELVTREQLIQTLWPEVVVTEASLDRCVKEARRALGDEATRPTYIQTVPRSGYRFIAETRQPKSLSTRRWAIVAAIAVTAIVALSLLAGGSNDRGTAEPDDRRPDVTAINADRAFREGLAALAQRSHREAKARTAFEQALEIDPRHAPAMAGLALTTLLAGPWPPDAETRRRTLALAERALSIDPDLALAYTAIGKLHAFFPAEYPAAEAAFRRALSLDENNVEALVGLAMLAASDGRLSESIELQRRAAARNPSHTALIGNLAISLSARGRQDEALELILPLRERPQTSGAMVYPHATVLRLNGQHATALSLLLDAHEAVPRLLPYLPRSLARSLIDLGEIELATAIVRSIGNTCESAEQRFAREALLVLDTGLASAVELRELLARIEFANPLERAVVHARLAMSSGDIHAVRDQLLEIFPTPAAVTGWKGDFVLPADAAQMLAWALLQTGQRREAAAYLRHVASEIDRRRAAGYRNHFPTTVLDARNAALLDDVDTALALLKQAVEEGWVDLGELEDPRWSMLDGHPAVARLERQLADRAQQVRTRLSELGFYTRVNELVRQSAALEPVQCPAERDMQPPLYRTVDARLPPG